MTKAIFRPERTSLEESDKFLKASHQYKRLAACEASRTWRLKYSQTADKLKRAALNREWAHSCEGLKEIGQIAHCNYGQVFSPEDATRFAALGGRTKWSPRDEAAMLFRVADQMKNCLCVTRDREKELKDSANKLSEAATALREQLVQKNPDKHDFFRHKYRFGPILDVIRHHPRFFPEQYRNEILVIDGPDLSVWKSKYLAQLADQLSKASLLPSSSDPTGITAAERRMLQPTVTHLKKAAEDPTWRATYQGVKQVQQGVRMANKFFAKVKVRRAVAKSGSDGNWKEKPTYNSDRKKKCRPKPDRRTFYRHVPSTGRWYRNPNITQPTAVQVQGYRKLRAQANMMMAGREL